MARETLELFQKGCLGTCWYGKYHYIEPWAGCGHDCHYCYARFRSPVVAKLRQLGTTYDSPKPLFPESELPGRIAEGVRKHGVRIAKLCRYTDILNPAFVRSGLSFAILKTLAASPAQRIILTTKGLPDRRILALIRERRDKFSYNAAVRPSAGLPLEPRLPPWEERLAAAASLKKAGVLTTIHLDPVVAGIDDDPLILRPFLERLRRWGLLRVMFSYLLLCDDIMARLRDKLPRGLAERIVSSYDLARMDEYLPGQGETASYSTRPGLKRASVDRFAGTLREMGFEFVLCSLKSTPGRERGELRDAHPCDGTFYA